MLEGVVALLGGRKRVAQRTKKTFVRGCVAFFGLLIAMC